MASLLVQEANRWVIKLYLRVKIRTQNKAECDLGLCVWDDRNKEAKVHRRKKCLIFRNDEWQQNTRKDVTYWSQWNYLHLEILSQGREKPWRKFADVDLLKKKKAEGARTKKIETEENAELKTSSKLILLALPWHFIFISMNVDHVC